MALQKGDMNMGGGSEKTTSTSGPSNPDVNALLSRLSRGVSSAYQPGGSTYVAPSANTTGGWASAIGAAGNEDFAGGLAGALKSYGNRASGAELGINDPLYAAQRAQLTDDVLTGTNTAFNNSGLFGSDQNQFQAARGLTAGLGALDTAQRSESYGRQAEAANMLGSLFQNSLMPSSVQSAVGGAQDADAAAKQNGGIDYLRQFTSLLGGMAGASPTTTTTSTPTQNPFLSLLGLGLGAL
jgi:hypothetical protein